MIQEGTQFVWGAIIFVVFKSQTTGGFFAPETILTFQLFSSKPNLYSQLANLKEVLFSLDFR